jgi:hypothetical protein
MVFPKVRKSEREGEGEHDGMEPSMCSCVSTSHDIFLHPMMNRSQQFRCINVVSRGGIAINSNPDGRLIWRQYRSDGQQHECP